MRPAAICAIALASCLVVVAVAEDEADPRAGREPDVATLYADHYEDGEFFNPWGRFPHHFGDLLWFLVRGNPYDRSADPEIPLARSDGRHLAGRESSASVTWVGHATVAVHDEEDVFLTDPHFGPRALVLGRWSPPGIPIESVPDHAFAVLSHNHYDHLDAGTVDRLPDTIDWYVPLGLADWFRARGKHRVEELDWWESTRRGRWTITCLPSQHWSRRIWQGRNTTLWCSWLLDNGERRYYFAGDTGYFHGFREFARRFGPIDVALLPIGAFEPRDFMRYQHLSPDDAVQAFLDLEARWLVPLHWGCFDLAFEPLDLPPKLLQKAVSQHDAIDADRVPILAVGQRWEIPGS